jgi:opacity protein-like surface antigen
MKKSYAIVLLLVLFGTAAPIKAQEKASKLEAYGGFDYMRVNVNARVAGFPPSVSVNGNGGSGQLEYNASNWLGIVGDLAGYAFRSSGSVVGGAFSYLFGPRLNFRHGKIAPFAQTLFGGFLATDGIGRPGPENHFAMTAGGGIDFKVTKSFSIRPLQAEYFMTKFPDGLSNRQNNFRFSTGIVLRLGG